MDSCRIQRPLLVFLLSCRLSWSAGAVFSWRICSIVKRLGRSCPLKSAPALMLSFCTCHHFRSVWILCVQQLSFQFCVSQFSVFEFCVAEGWAGGTTQWRFRLYYITCTEDSCHVFYPVPGKLKLFMCVQKWQYSSSPLFFVRCFVTSVGGRGKHLFGCISSRNKALIPAAFSACLKLPVFKQVIIERWCGVFIENSLHCQKAGTFWSFEERSGSDAFILFLPSLQECLQLPSSSSQILQSTSFWSKVQSVDHISPFIALGRWRVADRALPKKALRRCIFFHGK